MKILYITIVLLMNLSFIQAADTDLDAWNTIINSPQSDNEACSSLSDDCEPSKKDLKGSQDKNINEKKDSLKKEAPLVKSSVKIEEKSSLIKIDASNELKPEKKQKISYLKLMLSVFAGLLVGFIYRKRRKNNG
jgi:hypothetical protein